MVNTDLKIAVVHDFLYTYTGAERVLEQILNVFPDAALFSLIDFLPEAQRGFLKGRPVTSSFIQRMPLARSHHRQYLPLMPLAIEQLDVSSFDIVISSSYLAAKGVITRPNQLHICYCHSPIRYAWNLQHHNLNDTGFGSGMKSLLTRLVFHYIRNWDARSANQVDVFLSNSDFVARRIEKFYRRRSTTIYPPVDLDSFRLETKKEDYYLAASRMMPYKRLDLVAEAFTGMSEKHLIIVGEGPELDRIKSKAGPNVKLVGHQPFSGLLKYMQQAKAFVFAAEEDFGIMPVEAQACGTPVIAFGRGGATESVVAGKTGLFFNEQTVESLCAAVERFESERSKFHPAAIRAHAQKFNAGRFCEEFQTLVENEWDAFSAKMTRQPEETNLRRIPDLVSQRARVELPVSPEATLVQQDCA